MGKFKDKCHIALAMRVLAVAVVNYHNNELFDWAAYIDSVPGENHNNEAERVAQHGAKMSKEIATILFPHLPADKYRR